MKSGLLKNEKKNTCWVDLTIILIIIIIKLEKLVSHIRIIVFNPKENMTQITTPSTEYFHFILNLRYYTIHFFFCIFNTMIYSLNIFIFGCTGSLCCMQAFFSCNKQVLLSGCGGLASHCSGFSLWSMGSMCTASVVVCGLRCSVACWIFLDQGSNLNPLHWQADSQQLDHQESLLFCFYQNTLSRYSLY